MNQQLKILCCILISILFIDCYRQDIYRNVIKKENGEIILAYKAFIDFLETDKSWENYNKMIFEIYPEVKVVHEKQLAWGVIDSATFPEVLRNYTVDDYAPYLLQYDNNDLNYLYDSIIETAHTILSPVNMKQVDLCFFLPYGSCFVEPMDDRNTIFISMHIHPNDVEKIMAHEYSHILHFERRPEEPLSLKREIVSEGMAVYLTNQIVKDITVSNSIPFMPESSFNWCQENEQLIKDSISLELNDTTMQLFIRYISDGSFAKPPEGFVQKTGYFVGYRIIENCMNKGMTLEEICSLNAEAVIEKSDYFN